MPDRTLPLGPAGLEETRAATTIAPGVDYTRIVRGEQSPDDGYVVDILFASTLDEAEALAGELAADGYDVRVEKITAARPTGAPERVLGYLVRSRELATVEEANALFARLTADGYTGLRVVYSGEDGKPTTGPWVVNVLEVDYEAFEGEVDAALATEVVPGLERLTTLAGRTDSLAAINGGYFVIGAADGTPGDLAGTSVIDGSLVSEAVNGRTSLLLRSGAHEGAAVGRLSSLTEASSSDGASRLVDGLNRAPGLIRGCGGRGGDEPTQRPLHDFTCTDDDELIHFTPAFGPASEPGEGAEVALDADGIVVEVRDTRGGAIPAGGSVLAGTGSGATWLKRHAPVGADLAIESDVFRGERALALGRGPVSVVNGGPRLLRGRAVRITSSAEGFVRPDEPEFFYRFGIRRNPRTIAGVTGDGRLLLITVDGRAPGHSVGFSFLESARVMRALGAVDALNLDGGGSTTMTVGDDLVTRPSDTTGERPIADAILLDQEE